MLKETNTCLVIPTNRQCESAITSYVEECISIQNDTGIACSFVLIDSSTIEAQKQHKSLIEKLSREKKEVRLLHIDQNYQNQFITKLMKEYGSKDHAQLSSILNPLGLSYGAAANKTFLVAAALNCNRLYRRDSDTNPQVIGNNVIFPSKIENQLLGKRIFEVNCGFEVNEYQNKSTQLPLLMIGGNYLGKWAGDYEDIYNYNPMLLYKHVWLNMPSKSFEEVKSLVEQRYIYRNEEQYSYDKIQLVKSGFIEVGNHALYRIFLEAPLIPAKNALSTDYFYHSLLESLDLPKVYHNRHVHHFHTGERKTLDWFYSYHLRSAKYKALSKYLNKVLIEVTHKAKAVFDETSFFDNNLISSVILAASELEFEESSEVIDKLAEIYGSINISKYKNLANLILQKKSILLKEVNNDIKEFGILTRHWKDLCICANQCSNKLIN